MNDYEVPPCVVEHCPMCEGSGKDGNGAGGLCFFCRGTGHIVKPWPQVTFTFTSGGEPDAE